MGENIQSYYANMFDGCTSLKSVTLSQVGLDNFKKMFPDYAEIETVILKDTVTSINNSTFEGCSGLKNVIFSDSVKNIGKQAFYGCAKLKNVTIPASVNSISEKALGYTSDSKIAGFTIYGTKGTEAERYANNNGFTFIEGVAPVIIVYLGDADGDGRITISDVTAIQRHMAEYDKLTGTALLAADADGNGTVDINDATHLQRYLAEFDVVLGKQITA